MPSVSIHRAPFHSNISQSIAYEISKRWLLQHWEDRNLTHTADWDKIDVPLFKRSRETTTTHIAHSITKFMSNTLPTMTIKQLRGHATTNLCPRCGVTTNTIEHMFQCTHTGSYGRWTVSVDALRKWLEDRNTDPYIVILLANALLYIAGEINDLPQFPNLALHSDILGIGWSFIILGIIPTSLAHTKQTYFTHIRSKKKGI